MPGLLRRENVSLIQVATPITLFNLFQGPQWDNFGILPITTRIITFQLIRNALYFRYFKALFDLYTDN